MGAVETAIVVLEEDNEEYFVSTMKKLIINSMEMKVVGMTKKKKLKKLLQMRFERALGSVCCTPKHLVDLYGKSQKAKRKEVRQTSFVINTRIFSWFE